MKSHAPGAVSGLTFSILSLMTWWVPVLGLIFGLIGIWHAYRANRRMGSSPGQFQEGGVATAAMVCGFIGSSFSLLWNIVVFGFMIMLVAAIASAAHQTGAAPVVHVPLI